MTSLWKRERINRKRYCGNRHCEKTKTKRKENEDREEKAEQSTEKKNNNSLHDRTFLLRLSAFGRVSHTPEENVFLTK